MAGLQAEMGARLNNLLGVGDERDNLHALAAVGTNYGINFEYALNLSDLAFLLR